MTWHSPASVGMHATIPVCSKQRAILVHHSKVSPNRKQSEGETRGERGWVPAGGVCARCDGDRSHGIPKVYNDDGPRILYFIQ